jgi:hypothetical protein
VAGNRNRMRRHEARMKPLDPMERAEFEKVFRIADSRPVCPIESIDASSPRKICQGGQSIICWMFFGNSFLCGHTSVAAVRLIMAAEMATGGCNSRNSTAMEQAATATVAACAGALSRVINFYEYIIFMFKTKINDELIEVKNSRLIR